MISVTDLNILYFTLKPRIGLGGSELNHVSGLEAPGSNHVLGLEAPVARGRSLKWRVPKLDFYNFFGQNIQPNALVTQLDDKLWKNSNACTSER